MRSPQTHPTRSAAHQGIRRYGKNPQYHLLSFLFQTVCALCGKCHWLILVLCQCRDCGMKFLLYRRDRSVCKNAFSFCPPWFVVPPQAWGWFFVLYYNIPHFRKLVNNKMKNLLPVPPPAVSGAAHIGGIQPIHLIVSSSFALFSVILIGTPNGLLFDPNVTDWVTFWCRIVSAIVNKMF